MAVAMSDELFEQLVDRAVAQIPSDLAELVQNCVVVIESRAPEPDGDLLGFYDGVPLSERDSWYSGVLPDRIVIYRDAILDLCDSEAQVVDEIRQVEVRATRVAIDLAGAFPRRLYTATEYPGLLGL